MLDRSKNLIDTIPSYLDHNSDRSSISSLPARVALSEVTPMPLDQRELLELQFLFER